MKDPGTILRFRIAPDGGEPFEVRCTSRDIAAWERTYRDASFTKLQADARMSDYYAIAHIAARRLGLFSEDAKAFNTSCDLVDVTGNADPDGPEDESFDDPPTPSGQ